MPATNQQDGTIPPTTTLSTPRLPKPPVLGQVCYVYESIATPIELIFLRTHAIQARPDLVQQCQEALDRIHAAGSKIGKVRPCIVMRPAISGLRAETVCLKGTFGGADPASMGKVYKHFVRGIFPNRGLPGSRHMHLVPEGRQEKSWVIAFEFETMRPIADTWSKAAQAGGYHGGLHKRGPRRRGAEPQHLEKISQAILRDECETSFDAWQAECQDHPETAVESLEEHRKQRHHASRTTLNSSASSLSLNAPSTGTMTMDALQEDDIADVKNDANQAFLPQDPCEICATRKLKASKTRKKSSIFSLRSARSFSKVQDLKAAP